MLNARTRQWLQALLLFMLGLYFLDNMVTGRIYFYINDRFSWLSWLSAILFMGLGIMGFIRLFRERSAAKSHQDHDHHDHDEHLHDPGEHEGHNHGAGPSWSVLSLIALPLLLGILIPAKPLGASAIGTSGVDTAFKGTTTQLNQAAIAPAERNVLDWIRAFNTTENMDQFKGQSANLVGFVYRDIRFQDKPLFMVARFTISCCVADASAIGVTVQSDKAATFSQDSWVKVTGTFDIQDIDGRKTPVLIAQTIESTNQPEHPYLYP